MAQQTITTIIDRLLTDSGAHQIEREVAHFLSRQPGGRGRALRYLREVQSQRSIVRKGQLRLFRQ